LAHKVWGGRHLTTEEIESFLKEAKIARFCSHNNDGTIHAVPVWFRYENEKIVILTPGHSRKAGNVRRDKNVSILIDLEKPTKGVLIYGRAELDDQFDLETTAVSIAEKYMSRETAKEQWRTVCPPSVSWLRISVKPEQMASFEYT
jgi:nitroimidazol reductase NimA-like FMN-containing flavoprotein (pyridoxamine 5'-phosphate oxidase superfamily)